MIERWCQHKLNTEVRTGDQEWNDNRSARLSGLFIYNNRSKTHVKSLSIQLIREISERDIPQRYPWNRSCASVFFPINSQVYSSKYENLFLVEVIPFPLGHFFRSKSTQFIEGASVDWNRVIVIWYTFHMTLHWSSNITIPFWRISYNPIGWYSVYSNFRSTFHCLEILCLSFVCERNC